MDIQRHLGDEYLRDDNGEKEFLVRHSFVNDGLIYVQRLTDRVEIN